jgi:hypothetical protein
MHMRVLVEAVAHDKVERRFRVIVGKVDKPSPTLAAYITAVNLNPTWTVPLSITKNEIIRHMRRDPRYLSRMHMRVLGARDEEISPQSVDWSSDRSPNFTIRTGLRRLQIRSLCVIRSARRCRRFELKNKGRTNDSLRRLPLGHAAGHLATNFAALVGRSKGSGSAMQNL